MNYVLLTLFHASQLFFTSNLPVCYTPHDPP